jgi:protein phosphatase
MENKPELISASISDRGLSEKRPQNEDSFVELSQHGVFAVADGVGGANAGDFASQMAMELLTEAVSNRSADSDAEELFRMAIDHANRSIHQMATDLPQLSSMATTIVALHLKGNIATVAHVGDSRIYRFTPDGQIFRETQDHSVVEEEVRAGRLSPEEALVHPSRNVISRAVGADSTVDIDVKTIMVEPNTTFLLCSDGITRHIDDEELRAIFATGADPRLICDHLKELCYSRGAEDNLTAVVVRTFADSEEVIEDFDSSVPLREEETVATARSAYATAAPESFENVPAAVALVAETTPEIDPEELDTGELEIPVEEPEAPAAEEPPQFVEPLAAQDTDEQFLLTEEDEEEEADHSELPSYTSSSVVVPARAQNRESDLHIIDNGGAASYAEEVPAQGGASRILFSLGFLLLGAAIAIAASYFLGFTGQEPQVADVPQVETMKTQNIPLTSFEEARRIVDKDPAAYASKTATPTDAADFYLLGRALLLTNKPNEAKRQLELARERLPQVDEAERKTLSNEIAFALAAIDNPEAIKNLTASAAGSSNSNSVIP